MYSIPALNSTWVWKHADKGRRYSDYFVKVIDVGDGNIIEFRRLKTNRKDWLSKEWFYKTFAPVRLPA